jgi:hypothetical protein
MGIEILFVTFLLMIIGPILGLFLGGFMHGSFIAHKLMIGSCVLFNAPFIVWFFTKYETKHLIPIMGIIALNTVLIVVPYIIFKRLFKNNSK